MAGMSRAQKKLAAIARARRRLEHRLDDIDWEEEVLLPELERIALEEAKGQKVTIELEAGDAGEDQD